MDNLVGKQIGQYRILAPLGRGGMGTVYRGFQSSLNRVVAIKVLSAQLAADPTFYERFRREATSVAGLNHPNILAVHDFGRDDGPGVVYIVMAFAPNGTLKERIGRIAPVEAINAVAAIADALETAHKSGIIHRDVKPTNILLGQNDWPLLADFGIARVEQEAGLTSAGVGIGTPEYMSPEQVRGRKVDGRSDVYSLGIVLHEVLAGVQPFRGEDPITTMTRQLDAMPPPLPDSLHFAGRVGPIVARALRKDPGERYQSAADMRDALRIAATSIAADEARTFASTKPGQNTPTPPPVTRTVPPEPAAAFSSAPVPDADSDRDDEPPRRRSSTIPVLAGVLGALALCACVGIGGVGIAVAAGWVGGPASSASTAATDTATPAARTTPSATRPPSASPTSVPAAPTPIPIGRVLFQDAMSNAANPNGWYTGRSSGGVSVSFQGGAYLLDSTAATTTSWFTSDALQPRGNYAAEIEIEKAQGGDGSGFGIVFGWGSSGDNYQALIRGDGTYWVERWISSARDYDTMLQPTVDSQARIVRSNALNRIRVVVRGNELTLYANDKLLTSVRETKPGLSYDGRVGVVVGSGLKVWVRAVRIFEMS